MADVTAQVADLAGKAALNPSHEILDELVNKDRTIKNLKARLAQAKEAQGKAKTPTQRREASASMESLLAIAPPQDVKPPAQKLHGPSLIQDDEQGTPDAPVPPTQARRPLDLATYQRQQLDDKRDFITNYDRLVGGATIQILPSPSKKAREGSLFQEEVRQRNASKVPIPDSELYAEGQGVKRPWSMEEWNSKVSALDTAVQEQAATEMETDGILLQKMPPLDPGTIPIPTDVS